MIKLASKNQTEACKYCKQFFAISEIFEHDKQCEKLKQQQQIEQIQGGQNPQSQQKQQQEQQQEPKVQPQKKKMNVVGPVEVYVEGEQQNIPVISHKPQPQSQPQPTEPQLRQQANKSLGVVNTTRCAYCNENFPSSEYLNHEKNCDAKIRMEILLKDLELIDNYQDKGSGVINRSQVVQSNNEQSESGKIVAKYLELLHQHQEISQGIELMQNAKWSSTEFQQGMGEDKCGKCQKQLVLKEKIYIMDCMHKYHKNCILERLKTSSKCHCGFELFN